MDHIIRFSSVTHYQGKIEEKRFTLEMGNNNSILLIVKKDEFNGKEKEEVSRIIKENKINQEGTYILESKDGTYRPILRLHDYNIATAIPYSLLSSLSIQALPTINKNNVEEITDNESRSPRLYCTSKVKTIGSSHEEVMFRKEFSRYDNRESFIEEIKCLLKLHGSEHIANLKYVQIDEKKGLANAIITEYYHICLEELIPKLKRKDLETKLKIALDLATALDSIQSEGIYHLDIKPSNIMLTDDLSKVKIIDFGMNYTPGRYIQGVKPEKNMVYALGITLLELSISENIKKLDKENLMGLLRTIRRDKASYGVILGSLNLKFKLKTVKEFLSKHPFLKS